MIPHSHRLCRPPPPTRVDFHSIVSLLGDKRELQIRCWVIKGNSKSKKKAPHAAAPGLVWLTSFGMLGMFDWEFNKTHAATKHVANLQNAVVQDFRLRPGRPSSSLQFFGRRNPHMPSATNVNNQIAKTKSHQKMLVMSQEAAHLHPDPPTTPLGPPPTLQVIHQDLLSARPNDLSAPEEDMSATKIALLDDI